MFFILSMPQGLIASLSKKYKNCLPWSLLSLYVHVIRLFFYYSVLYQFDSWATWKNLDGQRKLFPLQHPEQAHKQGIITISVYF